MKQLAGALLLVLAACAAPPAREGPGRPELARMQIDALRAALPGSYSNFAQVHGSGDAAAVTDVVVRHLTADREAAFLFSRKFRNGEVSQHQLYVFSSGAATGLLVARFAPLGEAQLAQPVPRILEAAATRFRPGCELALAPTPDGVSGQTNPGSCRFEHPEAGPVGLLREFNFGRGRLSIAERLVDDQGRAVGADGVLHLQKHRRFEGWAGMRVDLDAAVDDPAAWRLASSFDLADDGRIVPLLDAAGDPLDYGLQLARISWRRDRPPFLRLAVTRMATGEILAYAWAEPDSRMIGINLDWFQAGLEAVRE